MYHADSHTQQDAQVMMSSPQLWFFMLFIAISDFCTSAFMPRTNSELKNAIVKYTKCHRSAICDQSIAKWDVTKVQHMDSMFSGASAFKIDISKWDVSKVRTMGKMFRNAQAFNHNLCGSGWIRSNAIKTGMFDGSFGTISDKVCVIPESSGQCDPPPRVASEPKIDKLWGTERKLLASVLPKPTSARVFASKPELKIAVDNYLKSPEKDCHDCDIGEWDVSRVTDMAELFSGAAKFNGDISKWDVSRVKDMSRMFKGALIFNGDISKWDVSSANDMTSMFENADEFNADISKWDVSGVTDMTKMFLSADKFEGEKPKPWGPAEKANWRANTMVHRSYKEDVIPIMKDFVYYPLAFDVWQYGALTYLDKDRFPLHAVRTNNWNPKTKPSILVTGGVHGYETSGVKGALLFVQTQMKRYAQHFNIVVAPCVSPWGYERIERWTANAEDPNRGFDRSGSSCEECSAVQDLVESLGGPETFLMHIDLHETTDTDDTKFRPALAARDGKVYDPEKEGKIPDGFYLVADSETEKDQQVQDWLTAMIKAVRKVTHIAPQDEKGLIIGERVSQEGVIQVPVQKELLCATVTDAKFAVTTEVYPDSAKATDKQCNEAQVACVVGALDFLIENKLT